jgi:acetyl-CoA carboxylase carboxyl transferase subunit alpha
MLEHAYYSVISPEACASILYRDSAKAPLTSEQLKITSQDAMRLGVIEEILPEPLGGAHRNYGLMSQTIGQAIDRHLSEVEKLSKEDLLEARYQRFRHLGQIEDPLQIEA